MLLKDKKLLLTFIVLLNCLVANCASWQAPELDSLIEKQPYAVNWNPPEGSLLSNQKEIWIQFSTTLDPDSIGYDSVILIEGSLDKDLLKDTKDLSQALSEQLIDSLVLDYQWEADSNTLILKILEEDLPGNYQLIVSTNLKSIEGVPFNQSPGTSPQALILNFGEGSLNFSNSDDPSNPDAEEEISFGPSPDFLVINEFLYDGLLSETNGEAFIELYGSPNSDISLYQIKLINGANGQETDRITLPLGTLLNEEGLLVIADTHTGSSSTTGVANYDFLDNFDPQNGPDALQLFDRDENLLDAVTYGEGAVELSTNGLEMGEGDPALDVSGGKSLSRINGIDSDNNLNDFFELESPTPGFL